jgi:CheY-like chemotaxis protein
VRESLPDLLGELGFAVQVFSSAEGFLASDWIDRTACLILDIAMPGMTGPELQKVLKRRGSGTRGIQAGRQHHPPATLATYKVTLEEVTDLSHGFDPNVWDDAWKEWDCGWRQIARIDRKMPPSWKLADQVITAGLRGILFPCCVMPAERIW